MPSRRSFFAQRVRASLLEQAIPPHKGQAAAARAVGASRLLLAPFASKMLAKVSSAQFSMQVGRGV